MVVEPSYRLCSVLSIVAVLGMTGCGGVKARNLPKSPVSGEVTQEGKHLPEGQVVFIHETGEMASVEFKGDGKYQAEVAQGKNQVMVKSVEITGGKADASNRAASMEIQKSRIPDRYMMPGQSGLTLDVKTGPNTYNIELKAK